MSLTKKFMSFFRPETDLDKIASVKGPSLSFPYGANGQYKGTRSTSLSLVKQPDASWSLITTSADTRQRSMDETILSLHATLPEGVAAMETRISEDFRRPGLTDMFLGLTSGRYRQSSGAAEDLPNVKRALALRTSETPGPAPSFPAPSSPANEIATP